MVSLEWEINKNLAGLLATKKAPPIGCILSIRIYGKCNYLYLVNVGTRQWNEGLIDGIFAHEEMALIKKNFPRPNWI